MLRLTCDGLEDDYAKGTYEGLLLGELDGIALSSLDEFESITLTRCLTINATQMESALFRNVAIIQCLRVV